MDLPGLWQWGGGCRIVLGFKGSNGNSFSSTHSQRSAHDHSHSGVTTQISDRFRAACSLKVPRTAEYDFSSWLNYLSFAIPEVAATKWVVSAVSRWVTFAPKLLAIRYALLCSSFSWLGTRRENTNVLPTSTSLRIVGINTFKSGICESRTNFLVVNGIKLSYE